VSSLPADTSIAAEPGRRPARRRRDATRARLLRGSVPYLLVVPVVAAIVATLGYPIYSLVRISLEKYTLFELIQRSGKWIGLDNFSSVLHDHVFWDTVKRTIVFTIANVGLTMVFGTLIALLLVRVSSAIRIALMAGLVLVWSMPAVVAVQVFYWMTNFENGVVNYIFGLGQYDWYGSDFLELSMVTALIVWAAIPFVVITLYAGLAQVPQELVEAAEIDGARGWRIFRDVTFPILKPIFLILTSLSIIWDFGVFTQPFLLIGQGRLHESNYLMATYLYQEGYAKSDYGRGAAISILMLLIVALLSVFYVRKMVRTEGTP
jgi:N,N'-diacetylchitobiose transport system permease protein